MVIGVLLGLALTARADSGNARAEKIARATPRVAAQLAALAAEAREIKDPERRRELVDLLDGPRLRVLERRADEADILTRLKAAGLAQASLQTLIPAAAMSFIAAPAGVTGGHHAYPGGLVDHTLFNVRAGLALAADYRKTYGVPVDDDAIRAAAILHDAAKTATMRWNDDGTLPAAEVQVAGTGLHHILDVAEALLRGWPARLVVCVASAHSPPEPGPDLDKLLSYLRAAAIVAGKTNADAGLSEDGKALAAPAPIEAFITSLDDHDYVFTETAGRASDAALAGEDPWTRDEIRARESDVARYVRTRRFP